MTIPFTYFFMETTTVIVQEKQKHVSNTLYTLTTFSFPKNHIFIGRITKAFFFNAMYVDKYLVLTYLHPSMLTL